MRFRSLAALFFLLAVTASAQEAARTAPVVISGLAFGDYYTVLGNHNVAVEGKNGFWLRRAYLTFDRALGENLSGRLRFEVNSPGDFRTNDTMRPFVKDAFVSWKRSEQLTLVAGLSPTPVFETVERVWGYRAIERTPLDLQRMSAPRDFGIAAHGFFAGKRFRYHAMVGNGANTGSETNQGKLAAVALDFAPSAPLLFQAYVDHDQRPNDQSRNTLQLFGAVQRTRYRAGLQVAHQRREGDHDIDIASAFGVYNVTPALAVVGRIDRMFDPNPDAAGIAFLPMDPSASSTLLIAGVDWKFHKNVSVIPNIEAVTYQHDRGLTPDNDVLARLTLYVTF